MPPESKIVLTGSTGFVGSVLLASLHELKNYHVTSVVRSEAVFSVTSAVKTSDAVIIGDINSATDYSSVLIGVDVVIHVAARAHVMCDEVLDALVEYRKVNVEGTLNLARYAAIAGVKRFIYISSVKVCGESTSGSKAFVENDVAPSDPYGVSKMEAENALRQLSMETGMEVVIIRPPLVYGHGVKANFLNLLKLSDTKLPLPFACVNNKRSMIYVRNLVDFIVCCIDHPNAANQTFLISDGEDLSLMSLITYIRKAMGRSAWLLPMPIGLFKLVGRLAGKSGVVDRLVGDLQVDPSKAKELLNWTPQFTVEQGIAETVSDFINRRH